VLLPVCRFEQTTKLDHKGNANFRDNTGVTPLMLAAARGYETAVRMRVIWNE
jgi:hypothetical protein